MTREEMQQIREIMREELAPINTRLDGVAARLDSVDARLDKLEENATVTREAVNSLCEWADNVAVITQIRFPVNRAEKAE